MDLSASTVEQLDLTAERANAWVELAIKRRDAVAAILARKVLSSVVEAHRDREKEKS